MCGSCIHLLFSLIAKAVDFVMKRRMGLFHGGNRNTGDDNPAYKGSGFGLGIAKKLVELGGGRIWLEPQREVGAAIHFTSPIADAGVAAPITVYQSMKR